MVQLNETAFWSGVRDPALSPMRPTIYRPSRPVATRTDGTTSEKNSAVVDPGARTGELSIIPRPYTPSADRVG